MQVTNRGSWRYGYLLGVLKSVLVWMFTLTVCFLVVGFPVVVILMTVGVLAAMVLQSVFPASALIVVSSGMLGTTMCVIFVSSIVLTMKGIHPSQVKWLGWLQEREKTSPKTVYASCPLTCGLDQV
ncbi:MAG: hypothetical protein NZ901_07825 [Geminocystis sp.]|nr:hypothetical protein [Geminocystis sp.]HIK37008.1 hypothetical protein [Geminocystis sp. M7585_C2015_104]MCS7148080.1 hypothetical protein [Geminocystis sp.]MCX8077824.1 hypothetical protein [Geminocystis sp.]MDW8116432.1 hypothetical protein [Geminocystis sp.]